jgi:hypothetical protein
MSGGEPDLPPSAADDDMIIVVFVAPDAWRTQREEEEYGHSRVFIFYQF